jgi:type I restriction enzyme S subunit
MNELPHGWIETTFHEVFDFKGGSQPPKSSFSSGSGEGLVRLLQIRDFEADDKAVYIKDSKKWPKCDQEDIMVGRYGASVGKVLSGKSGAYNVALVKWLFDPAQVKRSWVWYLLKSEVFQAPLGQLSRSAQNGFNKGDVSSFKLPLPPFNEQDRIANKLDNLTARTKVARDELAHIPLLIEHYKQAILEKAFSGKLTADWRAQQHLIPPKSGTLDQLIAVPVRNGLSVRGSDQPPGVRALRLSSLRTPIVTMSDVRYLPIDDERASRYLLAEGDVLVSRGNGTKAFVGLASLVPRHSEPTIFPDTAFRIRLKPDRARPDWFSIIWNAPQAREQIEQAAKTTAGIWKISQGDLSGIKLNIPDTREQVEIVRRVQTSMDWLNAVAAEQGQASYLLNHLDQGLLAKAFYGELVPQDPNDEPAEKLLERIRAARSTEPKSRRGRRSRAAA